MEKNNIANLFKGDKVVWIVFFLLCMVSIIEVFSASSELTYKSGDYLAPILKHLALLGIGFVFMVCMMRIPCKYFKTFTYPLLLFSFVTLIAVIFVAKSVNGSQRWLGPIQPSEFAKLAVVLATAQILSAMQTPTGAAKGAFKYVMWIMVPFVLLIGRENLSTGLLLFATVVTMMFLGRVPSLQLGKLITVLVLMGGLLFGATMAFGHDKRTETPAQQELVQAKEKKEDRGHIYKILSRLDTWKARWDDFTNKQYVAPEKFDLNEDAQVGHANIAIATSNVIGKGPGKSVERDFLPQAFSDFIYAIIIEELGLLGAIIVAALYIILLVRASLIARRCKNNFPAFLVMGLSILMVFQALFNMGVAVGVLPVTGQPLPLVSKGGNSTVLSCVYIGIILSVSRSAQRRDKDVQPLKAVVEGEK